MREYQLAKQDMVRRLHIAEQKRLLNSDKKSVTTTWGQRLRAMVSSDNMAKDTPTPVSSLTPRHSN